MLILNFKTYPEATGENTKRLLDAINDLQFENPAAVGKIYCAVSMPELLWAKENYPSLNIISQDVDFVNSGSTTGWIPAENLVTSGIEYSVLNHSEHRVWNENIVQNILDIESKGLKLIVCCENLDEATKLLDAKPFAIAFEERELIGSGKSITSLKPDAVREFIKLCSGKTKVIIGAGISTEEDVTTGLEMGAEGFILASAFVKSSDPKAKALELVKPFLD